MKIAITTVQVPFVRGGAEFLAENLKKELIKRNHEAEIITIPFNDYPLNRLTNQIVASRLYEVDQSWGGKVDLCIGLKFPAYFIKHPNKVLWMLHQYRQVYDLFQVPPYGFTDCPEGNEMKKVIMNADNKYLTEAKRIYTISKTVSNRLLQYNQLPSKPLYHPCPDMELFHCGTSENYILMPSRINQTKRQMLALEAMTYVHSDIKLYLVGRADNEEEMKQLLSYIDKNNLSDKVKLFDFVSQEKKIELYANAKAVLFIPKDEDYGYITIEAMASGKPVITAKDSGGPLEFIDDGENGFVVEPKAVNIAQCIDNLEEERAKRMGQKSLKKIRDMNLSWDHVIKELTK